MKQFFLSFAMVTFLGVNLLAVPAAPFLITFSQPDGSTFQAHLKGDENFSWIELKNKMIIIKSKKSGFFEYALLKLDVESNFEIAPSGIPVIKIGESSLRSPSNIPKVPIFLLKFTSTFEFVFERVVVLICETSLLYKVKLTRVEVAALPVES